MLGLGVGSCRLEGGAKVLRERRPRTVSRKVTLPQEERGLPLLREAEPAVWLGIMCQFGDPARRGDPILGLRFSS